MGMKYIFIDPGRDAPALHIIYQKYKKQGAAKVQLLGIRM